MNKSDLVVLGFLNRKPMYGYEIIQFTKLHELDVWAGVKMPSIYKALQRLESNTFISGKQVVEGNNPPRKVFRIAKKGKEHFRETLKYFLESKSQLEIDFWIALSFLGNSVSKKYFLELLETRIKKTSDHIKKHQEERKHLKEEKKKIPFYIQILMNMGEDMHKIEKHTLQKLKSEVLKLENEHFFLKKEEI